MNKYKYKYKYQTHISSNLQLTLDLGLAPVYKNAAVAEEHIQIFTKMKICKI